MMVIMFKWGKGKEVKVDVDGTVFILICFDERSGKAVEAGFCF